MFATLFLLFLLQPAPAAQSSTTQGLQRKLQTRVENYRLSEDSFLQALTKVASQFQIPLGIEWVKGPSTMRSFHLSIKRATVYQVIESLVKNSGYRLEIKKSIVHVFPRGSLTDRRSFLNVPIKRFEVQDEFVAVAARRLRNMVNGDARQRHTSKPTTRNPDKWSQGTGTGGSAATGLGDERISLKLQNVRARDILDSLSLAAGLKIWVVTYPRRFITTEGGFRRTAAMHTDIDVADEALPIWVFLRWGVEPLVR